MPRIYLNGSTNHVQFVLALYLAFHDSLRDTGPDSGDWLFEEYTLEECEAFVMAYRATLPEHMQSSYQAMENRCDVDLAEDAMIKLYRPCLNTAMNPDPLPLPERYQRWPDENASSGQYLKV